jgi:Domain of unknown function (DUF3943)
MHFANPISKLVGGLTCLLTATAYAELPIARAPTTAFTLEQGQLVEPSPARAPPEGFYFDPKRGRAPFQPEYDRWFGDERRPPHYGRAALELGGVLAVGTTYYWIVSDPNKVDWDYVDIGDRATHVDVKFDNNMFRTNFLLHPLAGTMTYWLSRVNGLDIYWAIANSALSSATFEFVLEWLEKPSINDLVVTPVGGIAGGEFFFHLGDYLNSAFGRDNAFQRALAFSLGLPEAIHHPLDGVESAPPATPDALGYSSAYWHRFGLGFGAASVTNDSGARAEVYDLVFDVDLVAMPGFLRPGTFGVAFHQGNFTEGHLRTSVNGGLLKDADLRIAANLVGHYAQDWQGAEGTLRGSASMLAASVEMRYVDRWLLGRRDQFSIFHFLGPSAKAWLSPGGGLMAKTEGRLHLDLAGIRSPAYEKLAREEGSVGTKSVLQLQNYYQGLGASGRLSGSLGFAGVEMGGYVAYGTYRSIDGLDRYYSPRDATNTDQILELGVGAKFEPPSEPLMLRIGWDEIQHRSAMGSVSVPFVDRRISAHAVVVF